MDATQGREDVVLHGDDTSTYEFLCGIRSEIEEALWEVERLRDKLPTDDDGDALEPVGEVANGLALDLEEVAESLDYENGRLKALADRLRGNIVTVVGETLS